MPNWCENDLRVHIPYDNKRSEGEQDELMDRLKAFVEFAETDEKCLDEEQFIPYPKKFKELDEKKRKAEKKWRKMREKDNFHEMSDEKQKQWVEDHDEFNPWNIKDGFNQGGYEWCIENWGTKWGICDPVLVEEDYEYGELFYQFQSAWGPPLPVILAMSRKFPELEFSLTYFEGGVGFNGRYVCQDGKVLCDEQGQYFGYRGG